MRRRYPILARAAPLITTIMKSNASPETSPYIYAGESPIPATASTTRPWPISSRRSNSARLPDHAACLEYRARLLRDMGDTKGSVTDFQRVFELQQRPNPGHYISVADMLEANGPEGVIQALAILDGGNAKLGVTPQLQKRAIRLELQRGRPDLAIERLDALKPMLGHSPEWKVEMAELQLQSGEEEAASQLLKEATEQLDSLRKTPARQALRERVALIQARG